jgi:hypothetical protein
MPDNSPTTDPLDIVTRLIVLAGTAEISIAGVDKRRVALIARDAVHEIQRLRRKVEALEARIDELQRNGHRC